VYNIYYKETFDDIIVDDIPFVIICWNNLFFCKKIINQIKKYNRKIIILNNNSEYNNIYILMNLKKN